VAAFIGRREFITLLGSAVVAWPLRARAQQSGERLRRIGCLMLYNESDPAGQSRAMAFQQGLEKLGWSIGRNLVIDLHWGIGDAGWIRSATMELLMRSPDLILANGGQAVPPVQQASRSVPIIFIGGSDPVAEGYVQSLGHPGSNSTGFTTLEPSVGAKLLGLLKEIAPHVVRAVLIFNPDNAGSLRLSGAAQAAAQQFDIEVIVDWNINATAETECECVIAAGVQVPRGRHVDRRGKVVGGVVGQASQGLGAARVDQEAQHRALGRVDVHRRERRGETDLGDRRADSDQDGSYHAQKRTLR